MSGLPPIMVVDDDPDDLFIVRRLLSKAAIPNKVVAFEDPRAALDHLSREGQNPDPRFVPCVVVTDLNMPTMSGLELTRWIRAHPTLHGVRVVVISDSENPGDEAAAYAAGATRFVRKFPTSHGMKIMIGDLPCTTSSESAS